MGVLENISACAAYLGDVDAEERTQIFERLFKERVNIKRESIMRTYKDMGEDWNQTPYSLNTWVAPTMAMLWNSYQELFPTI